MAHEHEENQDITQNSVFISGNTVHIDVPLDEQCPVERVESQHRAIRSAIRRDGFVPDLKGRSLEEVTREAQKIKVGEYFETWYEFNRCLDSLGVLTGRGAAKYNTKRNFCVRVCKFGKVHRKRRQLRTSAGGQNAEADHPEAQLLDIEPNPPNVLPAVETGNLAEVDRAALPAAAQHGDQPSGMSMVALLQSVTPPIQRESLGVLDLNRNLPAQQGSGGWVNAEGTAIVSSAPNRQPRPIVRHTRAWLPTRNPTRHGRRPSRTGACGQLSRFLVHESDGHSGSENEETSVCPFRVRAQRLKTTGRIQITKVELQHTCPQFPHKWRGPSHKSHWMAVTLAPVVIINTRIPVREMLDGLSMQYHRSSNYAQMWRAKDQVRDWYLGGQRASFHLIPALCQRLVETDPGSIVTWCTARDSSTFKRAFVCPSATRNALQYLQPMICLDACHTKNRKFPTQLFLATSLDGNSKVVILCYAVAEVENTDNWVWFLQQMHRALHGIDDIDLPIVSDRQKGLLAAVHHVFPDKVHAHCANHLRANVKKSFGKGAELFFVALVYANTRAQFDDLLERLKKGVIKGAAAVEYIQKLDAALWARHAFPLPRLGKVSSNPAEQANSGLLSIREFAPFKLMVELMHNLTKHFNARRIKAQRARDMFTETAMLRHNVNLRHYQQWQVLDDGQHTAKVMSRDGVDEFLVKLHPKLSCTCFELQEMLWPCEHIMAWDDRENRDFNRHFHRCWKNSSLRSLYAPTLPCFLVNDLRMSTNCYPPTVAVRKGRHRMVRIEGGRGGRLQSPRDPALHLDFEGQLFITYPVDDDPGVVEGMPLPSGSTNTQSEEQTRKRKSGPNVVRRKCGLCRGLGHNRRSCHMARQADPPPNEAVPPEVPPEQEEVTLPLTAPAPSTTQEDTADEDVLLNYEESSDDDSPERDLDDEGECASGGVVPIENANGVEFIVHATENIDNSMDAEPSHRASHNSNGVHEWFRSGSK